MGVSFRAISENITRQFFKPLITGNELKNRLPSDLLNANNQLRNFADLTPRSLGEVFASRTGLATTLTPFLLRSRAADSPDKAFDGLLVGANGQTFPPDTPLQNIPAVTPSGGARNAETLIYVNGIQTNVAGQTQSLQAIADRTGSRVIGIHNATTTFGGDILQSLGDKLDIGRNPAADTLADTIYNEIRAGRGVHLMGHSQGAIITSRALQDVQNRLMLEDGMSRRDAERLMGSIKVETFGGASRRFPDGPQYVHYVNRNDGVPQAFGLRSWLNPFAQPGRDAVIHYFREGRALISHGFEEFYLPERVSFEDARGGNFN